MTLHLNQKNQKRQGHLIVISGPSGVGKGTLVDAVRKALPDLAVSVSATTRPPRSGEREGITYFFKTDEEFDELIRSGSLLEWASNYGYRYGTLLEEVRNALNEGKDLILEIDPQGDEQVRELIPETFSIFIAPPSLAELRSRLEKRATESKKSIEKRFEAVQLELQTQDRYTVTIINDDLEKATQELISAITRHCSDEEPR